MGALAVKSSSSNGVIKRAAKEFAMQTRTMKSALDLKSKFHIQASWSTLIRLVEYAFPIPFRERWTH